MNEIFWKCRRWKSVCIVQSVYLFAVSLTVLDEWPILHYFAQLKHRYGPLPGGFSSVHLLVGFPLK